MAMTKALRERNGLIARLSIALLFPFLIIALIVYLTGFHGPIQLDTSYYNFMQRASIEANSWGISIPRIPQIEYGGNVDGGFDIIGILVNIGNFFINFVNILSMVINIVLSIFTTISAIIKLLIDFGYTNFSSSGDLSYWVQHSAILLSI